MRRRRLLQRPALWRHVGELIVVFSDPSLLSVDLHWSFEILGIILLTECPGEIHRFFRSVENLTWIINLTLLLLANYSTAVGGRARFFRSGRGGGSELKALVLTVTFRISRVLSFLTIAPAFKLTIIVITCRQV